MDYDELEFELEDIYNAIEVEKYRVGHAYSESDIAFHMENIKKLRQDAAIVRKLMKGLMPE